MNYISQLRIGFILYVISLSLNHIKPNYLQILRMKGCDNMNQQNKSQSNNSSENCSTNKQNECTNTSKSDCTNTSKSDCTNTSKSDCSSNVEPLPESSRPRRDGPGGEDVQ